MKKSIIGGIITIIIGGTGYTISQSDVVNNFASNTGMTQQEAQKYVDNTQNDLESFTKIGQDAVTDGNSVMSTASEIDCVNYVYPWESSSLTCNDGLADLQTLGEAEVKLGNCYIALDDDLGSGANAKIRECITDIDALNTAYGLPITAQILSAGDITEYKNTSIYNKSVLQAALQSN